MNPRADLAGVPTQGGPVPATVAAVLYATSLAVVMLNVAPAVEVQLRDEAGLSVSRIGTLCFVELAAMGLATIPAYRWLGRVDEARVAQCAYAIFVAGSALSAWLVASFPMLVTARALTGLGAGTLMVLGMTAGARAPHPSRMFAMITFGQLASGAVILSLLPALSVYGSGLRGVYCLGALLGTLGLLLFRPLAKVGFGRVTWSERAVERRAANPVAGAPSSMLAIAFAAVFNIVVGGLWAFAGEFALAAGLSHVRIAQVFTGSTLVGMVGAAVAFVIGERVARRNLLLIGALAVTLGICLLHFARGNLGFAAGSYALSLGWNFSVPFVFAAVAAQDSTGRAVSSINLAFAFGLAVGPLLAGWVIEFAGLGALAPTMLGGMAFGTLLMLRVTRNRPS